MESLYSELLLSDGSYLYPSKRVLTLASTLFRPKIIGQPETLSNFAVDEILRIFLDWAQIPDHHEAS